MQLVAVSASITLALQVWQGESTQPCEYHWQLWYVRKHGASLLQGGDALLLRGTDTRSTCSGSVRASAYQQQQGKPGAPVAGAALSLGTHFEHRRALQQPSCQGLQIGRSCLVESGWSTWAWQM